MRRKRDEWLERIKGVEVEFRAARRATYFLREEAALDPTVLGGGGQGGTRSPNVGAAGGDVCDPPVRRVRDRPAGILTDRPWH